MSPDSKAIKKEKKSNKKSNKKKKGKRPMGTIDEEDKEPEADVEMEESDGF